MKPNLVELAGKNKIASMFVIATIAVECIVAIHILLQIFMSNLVAQVLGIFSVIQWIVIPVLFIWFRVQPVNKLATVLEGSLLPTINLATIEIAMIANQEILAICITAIWSLLVITWVFSKIFQTTVIRPSNKSPYLFSNL